MTHLKTHRMSLKKESEEGKLDYLERVCHSVLFLKSSKVSRCYSNHQVKFLSLAKLKFL
jgi:hypothetical protein